MAIDESSIVSKADKKGTITYINDKFCELSGYRYDELIGKPHNIIRHPDMPKEAFKQMWATLKNKKVWQGIVKIEEKMVRLIL
jgi:PAS domain S-box-containing protein